jgi:hypothetical protein
MTALAEKVIIGAPVGDGLPDQFLASFVAFAGIDDIQAGIERAGEQTGNGFLARSFKPDFGATETEDRYLHIGLTELPPFHS